MENKDKTTKLSCPRCGGIINVMSEALLEGESINCERCSLTIKMNPVPNTEEMEAFKRMQAEKKNGSENTRRFKS